MKLRTTALASFALAHLAGSASAGPWNREAGSYYAKAGYVFLNATELATPNGLIAEIPAFTKHEGNLYVEYGVNHRFTAIVDLMAVRRSAIEDFDSAAGFGDSRFGLQFQIARRGPWVYAARGVVQAPTGDVTRGDGILPTGSGAWEGDLLLGVGVSLWSGRGWAFAEAGHQARGEELRDAFVYGAQLGVQVARRLRLLANLRGVQPYDTAPSGLDTRSPVGLGDGVTYLIFGPGAILELGGGVGLQAEVDLPANVRSIAKGPTFRLGFFLAR